MAAPGNAPFTEYVDTFPDEIRETEDSSEDDDVIKITDLLTIALVDTSDAGSR